MTQPEHHPDTAAGTVEDATAAGSGGTPWPFFDLRLVTERLELRIPHDDDLVALARLAADGIHDAGTMPFTNAWTDQPPAVMQRGLLQWEWTVRGSLAPEHWSLSFAVVFEGQVVGVQDVAADAFPINREVRTGSWLGRAYQRRGIGTEMRAAVLHMAFHELGANHATTAAFEDNLASASVSTRLGYEADGFDIRAVRGRSARLNRYRMSRERWLARPRSAVTVLNLLPCLPLLGLESSPSPPP